MKTAPARTSRRNFLIAVSAGSAATVAAVAGKVVPRPKPATTGSEKRSGKGYEETAHVRNYYRTTQV
jgi:hypothetical protein